MLGAHRRGRDVLVDFRGELDLESEPEAREKLSFVVDHPPSSLTLDLRGVTFIDSRGMALLLYLHRAQRSHGLRLVVVVGTPQVKRALELTKLDEVLEVRTDTPSASR